MRGSISALTSALILLMILSSSIAYISLELRKAPTRLARLNYEVVSQLSSASKDFEVVYGLDGLYVRSANPPIRITSILALSSSGINTLRNNVVINKTYEKVLEEGVINNLLLSNSYILIVAEGGKYFIVGREVLRNSSNNVNVGSNTVNIQYLNSTNHLRPVLYVGILKDLNSYMSNPIPGGPSDPEANYIPVGYSLITDNSHTISKGDWFIYTDPRSVPYKIGHVYGSGRTDITYLGMGYYRIDSNHRVYVKWYESVSGSTSGWYISYETLMSGVAGFWAYPTVISAGKSINLLFEIKNLGSWVSLHLKPVIYVVSPEDYVKGLPIMPYQTNPTLEAPIRYPVIKPLYSWEGGLQVGNLGTNSTTTLLITFNTDSAIKSLNATTALALIGFRFASTSPLSIKLTSYMLNYDIRVNIGNDEVGKYVFLPTSSGIVPEVTSPDGSNVVVYRPSNFASSLIDYPVLFIPQISGTYVIRYRVGSYTSLPQLNLRVNLTGANYTPVVEYLRNQHLGGWSVVFEDFITLEPSYAVLKDYKYFTAGSETWYSGDLIRADGLPVNTQLNFTYYITAFLQGVTTLNTAQNRTVDYTYCWSSWDCYRYWRIYFNSYPNNTIAKLHISGEVLYPTGSYYLRFGVTVKLSDMLITASPYVSSVKYVYRSGGTTYTSFISTQFAELVRIDNRMLVLPTTFPP
ncbi:MAG: hypothetical protein QXR55_02145 [Sulfolobales archaeon]